MNSGSPYPGPWLPRLALALAAAAGCGHTTRPDGLTPYQRHEWAVRDFQRMMHIAATGGDSPSCAGLCQNAQAACAAKPVVCDSGTREECATVTRGCSWVRAQLPVGCGACAGRDDDDGDS